jgi:excisionase family DNA binding protein
MSAQVLSPREAADLLGVDHTTVRRWVHAGHCPNVFASLPGTRIGVPLWWVEQLISPEPPVVVGAGDGGAASLPTSVGRGAPTLRTVRGSHPRTA